jgi:Acyl-CoA synthetase (NDP forming)
VIRARTLDELIDVATLLSAQPVPRGRRVAVVTNAGGLGSSPPTPARRPVWSCRSRATRPAPRSPRSCRPRGAARTRSTCWGGATAESFAAALPPVIADPAFDAVIVLFVPTVGSDESEVGAAISTAAASAVDKPVLCVFVSANGPPAACAASRTSPASTIRKLRHGRWRALPSAASGCGQPAGEVPELERDRDAAQAVVRDAIAAGEEWLDAAATRRVLEAYAVPLVPERLAATPEEAIEAARELGYPVVLKTAVPGAHKTEEGGVILDLGDEEAVRARPSASAGRCSCSASCAAAPSCWPARCRIRSSARSSPSARGACSPS